MIILVSDLSFSGFPVIDVKTPDMPILATLSNTFNLVFGTFVPFSIILTCNVLIIIGVKRAEKRRNKMVASSAEHEAKYLMRMLLLVSLAYVFLSSSVRLFRLVVRAPNSKAVQDVGERYRLFLNYSLQYWAIANLWASNYAINFFMYLLGGGKRFRNDAKEIFHSCCHSK